MVGSISKFRSISKYYLLCQIGGWGFVMAVILLNGAIQGVQSHFEKLLVFVFTGLVCTHLLRNAILRYGWLSLPLKKGLPRLLLGVTLTCLIAGLIRYAGNGFLFANIIDFVFLIIPWTMIYILYVYIGKVHKDDLKRRRLEIRVKEMRQEADDSEVDIDFILSSLNDIRSSVDENPARSRAGITKFSNLLRRGYFKS